MTSCVLFAVPRDFLAGKTRRRHNYGVRIVPGEPSKGIAANNPPSCNQPMKKAALVLMFSAVAICEADAGETILRNVHVAQMNQPTPPSSSGVSCMPIGLTARGELVFPWECREIIERERGPVSADISAAPKDPAKTPALTEPPAASKDQPASRNTEPEQVGTIPDTAPYAAECGRNGRAIGSPLSGQTVRCSPIGGQQRPSSWRPGSAVDGPIK